MAFGSKRKQLDDENDVEETHGDGADADLGNSGDESAEEEDDSADQGSAKAAKPLHDEVVLLDGPKAKNSGGSRPWRCKHCNKKFTSSYTRIRHHFFGPGPGKPPQIGRCSVANDRAKYKKIYDKYHKAEKGQPSGSVPTKPLEKAFAGMERDAVDVQIMMFLCANGIPFNVLRSPQYYEMVAAIQKAPKGYKPPGYEKARTTLLDACKRKVESDLAPVRDTWYTHGVSVVSDGWTNMKNKPLINVMASNSRGSMFLYAEDFSGEEKTGEAIAQFLLQAIEEIGPSNVLQVIPDNASNCKVAGREIRRVHKHIFWSPCVVHTLNLVFKDFAKKFAWMVDTYQTAKVTVKFFRNHQHFLNLFRGNSELDLLKVSKTRFASHYILLKRLMDMREALTTTVVTNKWKELVKSCDGQTRDAANAIAQNIMDEIFWDEVKVILDITKPLYMVIKFSDGEGPKAGDIYEKMDNMLGQIKEVMTKEDNPHRNDWNEVETIIIERWGKMNWSFHCLSFALSPKYYDQAYLATPAPGGGQRKAPNEDTEVIQGVMDALNRIVEDENEFALLREEFNTFIMKKGLFAIAAVQADAATMNAIDWWFNYGSQTPHLNEVAKKVLSQPISSSSAERNWSTYSFIHSVKRNPLNAKTADKLVYIHANERLKRRFSEGYNSGPHYKWDVDPDNSLLEDSSLKLEQLRWASLEDEPAEVEPPRKVRRT
ncbi:hypothetical protein ACQ4PT_015792 [Festuca glaucescens]